MATVLTNLDGTFYAGVTAAGRLMVDVLMGPGSVVDSHTQGWDGAAWQDIHSTLVAGDYLLDVNVAAGSISIDPGDIRIGAVEIQDENTTRRLRVPLVNASETYAPLTDAGILLSFIDESGDYNYVEVDSTTHGMQVYPAVAYNTTDDVLQNGLYAWDSANWQELDAVDIGTTFGLGVGVFDDAGNRMPTMDTGARAGYMRVTDGTLNLRMIIPGTTYGAPNSISTVGIYEATPTVHSDGDAIPFHFTADGKLITDANVTLTGIDYTDDSAEFTVATSKGIAMMALATTDQVDAGDIGALKMNIHRQLAITNYDGTGTELFVGGNPGMVLPHDGTNSAQIMQANADGLGVTRWGLYTVGTNYGYNGASWDRIRTVNTGQQMITNYNSSGNELFNTTATGGFVTIGDGTNNFDAILDGQLIGAYRGMLMLGTDGTNYQVISTNAAGSVNVNLAATPIAGYGRQAVGTAGTPVQLPSNTATSVTIKALYANTGTIYVGTDASVSALNGYEMVAGDGETFAVSANTNEIYLDADTNGEGVSFTFN
jgi:hypothetical protein